MIKILKFLSLIIITFFSGYWLSVSEILSGLEESKKIFCIFSLGLGTGLLCSMILLKGKEEKGHNLSRSRPDYVTRQDLEEIVPKLIDKRLAAEQEKEKGLSSTEIPSDLKRRGDDFYSSRSSSPASDKRLKTDVQPLAGSLEKVLALQGVRFSWRKDEFPHLGLDSLPKVGFLAQDIEKVLPDIVEKDKDGLMRIHYAQLNAVIVEAIKEQKKEIDSLKRQVDELVSISD